MPTVAIAETARSIYGIREDRGFYFSAELDQLSGPQVWLRSGVHKDLLGPFVLGLGQNHLGELSFLSRLTQAEAALHDKRIRGLAKLPPGARPRRANARFPAK